MWGCFWLSRSSKSEPIWLKINHDRFDLPFSLMISINSWPQFQLGQKWERGFHFAFFYKKIDSFIEYFWLFYWLFCDYFIYCFILFKVDLGQKWQRGGRPSKLSLSLQFLFHIHFVQVSERWNCNLASKVLINFQDGHRDDTSIQV